jgi:hypothetical protein
MNRPSLASAIQALRTTSPRHPHVKPTEDEDDIAAVLEQIDSEHEAGADTEDDDGHWGRCAACGEPWPCPRWVWAQNLAVEYLGRAAQRYYDRARTAMARSDNRKRGAA